MKKLFIFMTLICGLSLMGCKTSDKPTLLVPAGSPLIAVAGMLDQVGYEVTTGPSLLPSEFIKGEKDIIVAPVIVGAKLFIAGSSHYQLAAVIGFSNLYIASKTPLVSIQDLDNKNVLAFGEHATPGIVLKTVIKDQSTTVSWGTDIKEMVAPFKTNQYDYVLISEPSLTILKAQMDSEVHTLSLKEALGQEIIQVGVFVHPNTTKKTSKVLEKISDNIAYLKENPEMYAKKILDTHQQLTTFGEMVIQSSIPLMDFAYQPALTIKSDIEAFFALLNAHNKELLLNQLPKQTFYYEK